MNNMQRLTPAQAQRQRVNRIERADNRRIRRQQQAAARRQENGGVEAVSSTMQTRAVNPRHAHHGHASNRVLYSEVVKSVERNVAYLRMKRAVIGHTQRSQQAHILTTLLDVIASMVRGVRPARKAA